MSASDAANAIASVIVAKQDHWACPICLESSKEESLRVHPCGSHVYHLMCLILDIRSGNEKCGVCRRTQPDAATKTTTPCQPPLLIRSGNVLPKLLLPVSSDSKCCAYCMINIEPWTTYTELLNCYHPMHCKCTIQAMLNHGIERTGKVYCRACIFNFNPNTL